MRSDVRGALLVSLALGCGGSTETPTEAVEAGTTSGASGSGGASSTSGSGGTSGGASKSSNSEAKAGVGTPLDVGAEDDPSAAPDADGPEPAADAGPSVAAGDKVDLLLMIDNSSSMNDKQNILRVAVPDLVNRLTNPACVDAAGNVFAAGPPGQACPQGQQREFDAPLDLHVGVISSSLGDGGANAACPAQGFAGFVPDRIDMAHLIASLPRGENPLIPSGFLTWAAGADTDAVNQGIEQMVTSVGEAGCGFEAQLESWYRFLVDPFPYRSLTRVPCPGTTGPANCVQPEVDVDNRLVLDDVLLEQRAAFLRPDSMLAVVMLTDENDCSLQVGNQSWVVLGIDINQPMFRGSSACAENPNDACCYNCALGAPEGCTADPICEADPASGAELNRLPADQDGSNLRCFEQKRRFGVDFLYPTQRYVNALQQSELCWSAADLAVEGCAASDVVQNPLFSGGRSPERVLLAGIVGVPWQAIASTEDASGAPLPEGQLRFQNARELAENDTWSAILGSAGVRSRPAGPLGPEVVGTAPVPPTLAQMIESSEPRADIEDGNAINGREFDTRQAGTVAADDLEYACIFPLPSARDCAALDPATENCDCFQGVFDSPLCEEVPGISAAGTLQYWAKAYPGSRQLEVLSGLGESAVVASICARNTVDAGASDFGYRPAMAAIIERLREQLP